MKDNRQSHSPLPPLTKTSINMCFRPLQNPELKKMVEDNGYEIILTEKELNGPERFAADNVISSEMCQTLIDLAVVRLHKILKALVHFEQFKY